MTENHNKGDHIKSEPKDENSLLHALRNARGNRADTEKRLKKELEVLFQEHVARYLEHLDLPTKITKAVNANRSELEVDIRSATTFFEHPLEENPHLFCFVENQGLTLRLTKSWTDFYSALLRRVAIRELNKSELLIERYTNDYPLPPPKQIIWNFQPNVRTGPIRTSVKGVVKPHKYGMPNEFDFRGIHKYTKCCDSFAESHQVHRVAYAYPVILKLKWD